MFAYRGVKRETPGGTQGGDGGGGIGEAEAETPVNGHLKRERVVLSEVGAIGDVVKRFRQHCRALQIDRCVVYGWL